MYKLVLFGLLRWVLNVLESGTVSMKMTIVVVITVVANGRI